MPVTVVTPPTVEPLSASEVKTHLRIDADITEYDTYIGSLIKAARIYAEGRTWRAFLQQTLLLTLDVWPADSIIVIPRPKLISVDSVKYTNTSGVLTTMTVNVDYQVDSYKEPARILPAYNQFWPELRDVPNAVQVTYKAGYGTAGSNVPDDLRQALLLIIGSWFERREEPEYAGGVSVPWAADWILQSYKKTF